MHCALRCVGCEYISMYSCGTVTKIIQDTLIVVCCHLKLVGNDWLVDRLLLIGQSLISSTSIKKKELLNLSLFEGRRDTHRPDVLYYE